MPLGTNQRLGPYEILDLIGSGGMAEVYRARDTRLDRTVAVKVLKGQFSERFEQEARAISGLSHPHICALYDVGEQDGVRFLVMEYVEGKPLDGPLPLAEALRLAIQLADALDHAHRRGICHRDLKPANILVTKTGAKLLDFGLAKVARRPGQSLAPDATATMDLTREGALIGTVRYMSPELLDGREADTRSDIFAFGAVLYQMLTGRQAFEAATTSGILTAILTADPPSASTLSPTVPPALDHLVSRCLAKDPDRRWQSATDIREELQWIAQPAPAAASASPAGPRRVRTRWWVASGFLLVALVLLGIWISLDRPAQAPPFRVFTLATRQPLGYAAISPDGRRILYQVGPAGRTAILVQDLDRDKPREIVPTGPYALAFWSSDGSSVGFFAETELKRVSVHGGAAVTVTKLPGEIVGGATWSEDGKTIVFSAGGPTRLYTVPAQGGEPKLLVTPAKSETSQNFVDPLLPPGGGGRVLLFAIGGASRPYHLVALNIATGRRTELGPGRRPAWSRTGHLIYEERERIWAMPFSLANLMATGPAFPVQDNAGYASLSRDGDLAFIGGRSSGPDQLVWRDRNGAQLGVIGQPQDRIFTPMLSPDGSRVAVWGRENNNDDIWVHDGARNLKVRLTTNPASEDRPIWSPDGRRLAFASDRTGIAHIYIKPADGGAETTPFPEGPEAQYPEDWSPDGRYLLCDFVGERLKDIRYLEQQPGDTRYEAKEFLATQFDEGEPNFSPDARFVVYSTDESGRREVYISRFPDGGGKVQVSTSGGSQPRWCTTCNEIFYVEGETLMAASVTTGSVLSVSSPRRLFEHVGIARRPGQQYDVSADGKRFVVIEPVAGRPSPALTVIQNWLAGFRE